MAQHHADLFSRLYLSSATHEKVTEEFFEYETHEHPPAFTRATPGNKAKLVPCLAENVDTFTELPADVTGQVLDAAVLVHFLQPTPDMTFQEYGEKIFIPYVTARLAKVIIFFFGMKKAYSVQ